MQTIQTILEQLKERNVKEVSKDLSMSDKRLRAALQAAGYIYSQSTKVWTYTGAGQEPLDRDLLEYLPKGSQQASSTTPKQRTDNTKIAPIDSLTADEIVTIRRMIVLFEQQGSVIQAPSIAPVQHTDSIEHLIMRVRNVQQEDRIRKSLYLNKSMANRLDQFAAAHRVQKQDVLELALQDFFLKYEQ